MTIVNITGATGTGGFSTSAWNAAGMLQIVQRVFATHTSTEVTYADGPDITLVAVGSFTAFDANGDPTQGTITSIRQTIRAPDGVLVTESITGFSLSVPQFRQWVLASNATAFESFLFGGADTLVGSSGDDGLYGYGGADTLTAGAGNDFLVGGLGNDTLNGGDGNDQLDRDGLSEGLDTLNGGAGDDIINAGAGDIIDGGDGTDLLTLSLSGSVAYNISTADLATGVGGTLPNGTQIRNIEAIGLETGDGNDTLTIHAPGPAGSAFAGGAGIDTIAANFSTATTGFTLSTNIGSTFAGYTLFDIERAVVTTGSGVDSLTGGTADDILSAGGGSDFVLGRQGNDVIDGGDGDDTLLGAEGNDTISGGAGADHITDIDGVNTLNGGDGNDIIEAGINDTVNGGAGDDVISGPASALVDGGAGFDTLTADFSGSAASILLTQTATGFTLTGAALGAKNFERLNLSGGSGNDTYALSGFALGAFSFNGGGGIDTFEGDFSSVTADLQVSQAGVVYRSGFSSPLTVTLTAVERLRATGGSGNDLLFGAAQNDILNGGLGNDTIVGGLGADILNGGDGDDTIEFVGAGTVIDGGAGTDRATLDLRFMTTGVSFNSADARSAGGGTVGDLTVRDIETFEIVGPNAANTFRFDSLVGANFVAGGSGHDFLYLDFSSQPTAQTGSLTYEGIEEYEAHGSAGAEAFFLTNPNQNAVARLYGNAGDDQLSGANQNDLLSGGADNDILAGQSGDDLLIGGAGADQLFGGAGSDSASYETALSAVAVALDGSLTNTGDASGDTFSEIENLIGSAFDDVLAGDAFANTLNGGAGADTASYAAASASVTLSLLVSGAQSTGAGSDTLISIENLIGSAFGDTLTGNAGANILDGGAGNDTMTGGGGDDVLVGGGGGVNVLNGGDGVDFLGLTSQATALFVDLAAGAYSYAGGGWDALVSVEGVLGGSGNDTLFGDTNANRLLGGGGGDTLIGRDGADTLNGEAGDDWLDGGLGDDILEGGAGVNVLIGGTGTDLASYASQTANLWIDMPAGVYSAAGVWDVFFNSIEGVIGGSGNDSIFGNALDNTLRGAGGDDALIGGAGADRLEGGAGSDWIVGGDGNDRLIGGEGVDVLTGGAGADTFDLGAAAGWDVAFDFNTAEDRFSLGGLSWLGFLTIDADGDGQTDDTLLGYAGGNFVAIGVSGLSLSQWNALVDAPASAADSASMVASAEMAPPAAWDASPLGVEPFLAPYIEPALDLAIQLSPLTEGAEGWSLVG